MKHLRTIVKLLLTVIICTVLYRQFDIRASGLVDGISDWRYIVAATVIPITIVPLLSANRWKVFLKANGIDESILALWRINWVSMFQGLMLPSTQGYDLLRIYYVERRNPKKRGIAGSTVFVERIFGLLILCVCSLLAMPFVATSKDFIPLVVIVLGMNVAAFTGLGLILNERFHAFYSDRDFSNAIVARVFRYIETFHGAIIRFPYRSVLSSTILLIGGFQLSLVAVVYLIFLGYGYDISFIQHLAIYPLIGLLTMVPITIGGFGVREGFFVYFYSLLGVPAEVAVGASITNYVIALLLPSCCGGILNLWDIAKTKHCPTEVLLTANNYGSIAKIEEVKPGNGSINSTSRPEER